MSIEILPNYPDLFSLEEKKINEIEKKCCRAGHLDPKESLLERITKDLDILSQHNLNKNDIYVNHRNMNLKFDNVDEFDAYTCNKNEHGSHADNLISDLPSNFGKGWCLRTKITNEIHLNKQQLRITCFVWGGAEQCPIEKSFSKQYHGYQRGDRDWFVTNLNLNLNIWIPDLLPAQISMFGFFQSQSSHYRLDLEKYVKIMGFNQLVPIISIKSHKETYWRFPSGPFRLNRDVDIIIEEETNIYHAIYNLCEYDRNKKELQIHFKNNQWIKDNKHQKINIFSLDLDIDDIFNERD